MFSQVDRSVERSTGGLGIGLALVKGLVNMHGGTVTATSDGQGRGTSFTVRLPLLERFPDAAADSVVDAAPPASGRRRKILVVDDHRDSAESMEMMLDLLGNDVRVAHDGLEALVLAERFRPDVILMDVGMPNMNGYDATRRIRQESWGGTMIIIALTGWGQESDRTESRLAGCDRHLVKPIDPDELKTLLDGLSDRP
jgi:CheY-like chemotaxis protein